MKDKKGEGRSNGEGELDQGRWLEKGKRLENGDVNKCSYARCQVFRIGKDMRSRETIERDTREGNGRNE